MKNLIKAQSAMNICTTIIKMPLLWNEVLSGTSDVAATHRVLIWATLAGEALVAIGILLEIEPPLNCKKILSFAAVIIGVIVGAAGTLLLLNFDESISSSQQSIILSQNDKIISLEARPWTKAQFDAIQALRGKVKDVGVIPESGCLECLIFAQDIELALHAAGVTLHEDSTLGDVIRGTGIFVRWPVGTDIERDPLFIALRKAGLASGWSFHLPSSMSPVRVDIPVLFVGEQFPQYSQFPYSPPGQSTWTVLPLRNPEFGAKP